jgi:hypothetical protein
LLAIVLGLRTWRHYLLGSEFKVQSVTDHRPLHHFMTQSNLSGRQVRWQQLLSEFNLTISYVQGKANTFADGLSRRPDLRLMLIAAIAPYDPWLHKIQQSMKADAVAYRLLRSATSSKQQPDYRTANGILYYVRDGLHRVYVPDANRLRLQLMQQFHSSPIAGHIGAHKVYLAMRTHYYWPSMEQNITAYVQSCAVCQRTKSTLQPKLPIYPLPVPQRPFELITLDWLGQFPRNSKGHDSVLNIVDKLSKWVIVIPCSKTMNTDDLCQVLWARVFCWIGLPSSIVGDRDARLTASQMRALCKSLEIQMKLSVAYHPQTDGQTEVFNRTLLALLRTAVNRYHSNWEDVIPACLYAYHNTIHSATGYTPHHLLFGWTPRDLRAPLALPASIDHSDIDKWLEDRSQQLQLAQLSMEHAREAMIAARKASARAHLYVSGDLVKVSTRVLPLRTSSTQIHKLQHKWIGPFTVLKQVNPNAYQLQLPEQYKLVHDVFSAHDMRPWLTYESVPVSNLYPPVQSHPSLNPVVQVMDRKQAGRAPRHCEDVLDYPTKYLVLLKDGSMEWIHRANLTAPHEQSAIRQFEHRFKRSVLRPCNPVRDYSPSRLEDDESEDEVDFVLERRLRQQQRA